MEVRDPTNKDSTQITFQYDGGCRPLWSTNTEEGFIGDKCGEAEDFGCDDGLETSGWQALNAGFERYFDCWFRAI
jgi:hypothetical protein